MISEKELKKKFLDGGGCITDLAYYLAGFRASEKTYLQKIAELEKEKEKLKKDIAELIDLGTDQVVTEKIVRLEKQNLILLDALNNVWLFGQCLVSRDYAHEAMKKVEALGLYKHT
jgi:hypothetical protein